MKRSIFFTQLITLFLLSCGQAPEMAPNLQKASFDETIPASESQAEIVASNDRVNKIAEVSGPEKFTNRKFIRTADYRIQVENVVDATDAIEKLIKQYGGYTSSLDLSSNTRFVENRISIRIPGQQFSDLLKAIGKQAIYTDYLKVNSKEVTEEFVDIQARLKTKKAVHERYTNILRNKAGSIEEILEAEEKIRRLQEEIDAAQGRLNYLQNQVALSTINLQLYQKVTFQEAPVAFEKTFGDDFKEAGGFGWSLITSSVLLLTHVWPFLILLGSIPIIYQWARRRRMASK